MTITRQQIDIHIAKLEAVVEFEPSLKLDIEFMKLAKLGLAHDKLVGELKMARQAIAMHVPSIAALDIGACLARIDAALAEVT